MNITLRNIKYINLRLNILIVIKIGVFLLFLKRLKTLKLKKPKRFENNFNLRLMKLWFHKLFITFIFLFYICFSFFFIFD